MGIGTHLTVMIFNEHHWEGLQTFCQGSLDGPLRRNCKIVLGQVLPDGLDHKLEHDTSPFALFFAAATSKYIVHGSIGALIKGTKAPADLAISLRGNINSNTISVSYSNNNMNCSDNNTLT
jgi:hypothetical protein